MGYPTMIKSYLYFLLDFLPKNIFKSMVSLKKHGLLIKRLLLSFTFSTSIIDLVLKLERLLLKSPLFCDPIATERAKRLYLTCVDLKFKCRALIGGGTRREGVGRGREWAQWAWCGRANSAMR